MRLPILAAVLLAAWTLPAAAAWDFEADEDPLNDVKTGYITQDGEAIALAFKCWESDPKETMIMVLTPLRYDAAANYKELVEVQVRADKGEVRTLKMKPTEASGFLSLMTNVYHEPDVLPILAEIGKAQKRIAIGMMDKVHTVSATGSAKAVKQLSAQCKLPSE